MIVDAIIALALSALLIGSLSRAVSIARSAYDRARSLAEIIDAYTEHASDVAGLLPGESVYKIYEAGSSTVEIQADARWYGNDRIETDVQASSSGKTLGLRAVRSYPFAHMSDAAGTALCSPEFGSIASVTPIMLPVSALTPLTDLEVRNGIAYIAMDPSRQSDPDFAIIDIHDASHPVLLSSIDTGPGLASFALASNYVYAAARSIAAQLHVIKIDSLGSLSLATRYKLPLPLASTSPPLATSIFYDGRYIYLGTEKWDGDELSIIDASAPSSPRKVSGFETGSKIGAVYVRNGSAYVAAADLQQFRRVDVSDPRAPKLAWSMSPSGWQRQEAAAASAFEDDYAFGRTSGGFDIASDREAFFWAHATDTPASSNVPGGLYGMVIDRSHIYGITHAADQELSVYDRALSSSTASYVPLPVIPQSITCDLDKIYVLAKTAPAIYEVNFK